MGWMNHRYFVQFLFYACVNTAIVASNNVRLMVSLNLEVEVQFIVGTIGAWCVCGMVLTLCYVHVWMIISNRTTIEMRFYYE